MGTKSKAKAASDATAIPQGAPGDELTAYFPDLEQWPRSWMYEERDLSHGEQMVECFKPFLRHLVSSGQSRKTTGVPATRGGSSGVWTPGRRRLHSPIAAPHCGAILSSPSLTIRRASSPPTRKLARLHGKRTCPTGRPTCSSRRRRYPSRTRS